MGGSMIHYEKDLEDIQQFLSGVYDEIVTMRKRGETPEIIFIDSLYFMSLISERRGFNAYLTSNTIFGLKAYRVIDFGEGQYKIV